LSNILSIAEDIDGQTQAITTEIPGDTNYSKLNQYALFDRWGLSYDLNGSTTQKGTQHYIHDYRNRIVNATDGSSTVKFKYDALGRRIQKDVTIGSQSKTANFYYSGHRVIEERDGSNQVTRQLIYGNGIDEVIRIDKYNGATSTPYYLHRNRIGSTTAVTDASGNIIERVYYDIYGLPTFKDAGGNVISKSSISNNILFQGREYDHELNLYYFRARYYDPIMGRFLSTDPMGYTDSMNLYQGFGMNPVNLLDPMGEGILRLTLEKKYVDDPKQIPENITGKGMGKTEVELKAINYKINKKIKNGVELNKVEFDVSVYIKVYWSSKSQKYTAMHELGHVADMKGYLIMAGIPILKKVEKMEFANAQMNLMIKKINDAIVDFGYVLVIAQIESVMKRDSVLNIFWSGLNFIVDLGKTIIMKMPKTGVVTYNIKF
jgi:RHS repeat-associated protein